MKTLLASAFGALLLAPALGMAQPPADTLEVPGVMTTSGERFVANCTDEAFARVDNPERQARRCARLLADWRYEADLRAARRENPRLVAYSAPSGSEDADLPFDTVATFRNMPLVQSYHLD